MPIQTQHAMVLARKNAGGGGGETCNAWQSFTDAVNDYWQPNGTQYSQSIDNVAGEVVCKVIITAKLQSGTSGVGLVSFWSNEDQAAGSQYGSDSDTFTVTSTSSNTYTALWDGGTKPPLPGSGTVFMHLEYVSGDAIRYESISGGGFANGEIYNHNGAIGGDFYFELFEFS